LAFTATRLEAPNSQSGMNGQNYTQLLATVRFKVNDFNANAFAAVVCTTMEVIDRNGTVVSRASQTRFNNLVIYISYTLTGTVHS
jgi:hypothetical protein